MDSGLVRPNKVIEGLLIVMLLINSLLIGARVPALSVEISLKSLITNCFVFNLYKCSEFLNFAQSVPAALQSSPIESGLGKLVLKMSFIFVILLSNSIPN